MAAAAVTGWSDQTVVPTLTRCWTHPGEEPAAGVMTEPGRPSGIAPWIWSRPSNSQSSPKAIRNSRRPGGSG